MAVFFGTFENKVDRKGRVSVPAPFRQAIARSSYAGVIVRPSYRHTVIEGSDLEFLEALNESAMENDLHSEDQQDLGLTIFADSFQLPFDPEGRVILPTDLIDYAGITDRACFVGMGPSFQIWQPEDLQQHKDAARDRARSQGLTLSLRQRRKEQ